MSESKFETISSIVDNYRASDQASEQAIDEIIKDENLTNTWQNYHLIGDVMRNEIPQTLQLDLSEQIASAIADEPTVLAPTKSVNKVTSGFKAKVVQLLKPAGQLAIAASAAGLMIIGVQQNTADTNDVIMPSQVVQTTPLGGFANPVSYNYSQDAKSKQQAAREQRIAQQRRFQALLLDHQQQVKLSAVKKTDNEKTVAETNPTLEKSN